MDYKGVDRLLRAHDLGDDWTDDKNGLFDHEFFFITRATFNGALKHANEKTAWYWTDHQKHYLLADCNRFHWVLLGHMQEYLTRAGYKNPILGRAYGMWNGLPHAWGYAGVDGDLVFINWGKEEWPDKYEGKGSTAV